MHCTGDLTMYRFRATNIMICVSIIYCSLSPHFALKPDAAECIADLKSQGYRILVSDIHESSKSVHDFDWGEQKTAIIMGNEVSHSVQYSILLILLMKSVHSTMCFIVICISVLSLQFLLQCSSASLQFCSINLLLTTVWFVIMSYRRWDVPRPSRISLTTGSTYR